MNEKRPIITIGLIIINVIVFILMTLAGGTTNIDVLIQFGAKVNADIIAGQWWRFITPMFIHIGLMHIVVNMVTLYFIGMQIEYIFGPARYLGIYLVSGVAGNIASFAFNANAVSAGASTALFGLFGAYLMLGESFRSNAYIHMMARQFLMLIVFNIIFGFFSDVDLAGHLGGLFAGFLIAYVVGVKNLGNVPLVKRVVAGVALIAIFGLMMNIGFNLV
ncbi:rhomboid family intramembrane serine protease [Ligilactobacillus sp. WILCCON 0076]|uniref:Rhomboid family intramembrane serine protease n=1 Tax=Ligilactobacillus ubinensis TaxID=2876789 RepID=A0A9X2FLL9_9LACO|nr:rhomboid family intramembrane serine protease [Ligilactobacillus ubinensis]MCP0886793.1 rhomboid family intramembrane serine protease [Ligilactobacillus ubinensis]